MSKDSSTVKSCFFPSIGDLGCSAILTGGDHGEDAGQFRYCRGQTRGEAGRTRIYQQTLYQEIRSANDPRCDANHLEPFLGRCFDNIRTPEGNFFLL